MARNRLARFALVCAAALCACCLAAPTTARAAVANEFDAYGTAMCRLYNRWTGEHFYTGDLEERDALIEAQWTYEGVGWIASRKNHGYPVYRLYNSYVEGGDHHYTMDDGEYGALQELGWTGEGVGWYSAPVTGLGYVEILRQYNPFAATGTHNYTADAAERNALVKAGWTDEGVGWHGLAKGFGTSKTLTAAQRSAAERAIEEEIRGDGYSRDRLVGALYEVGVSLSEAHQIALNWNTDWVAQAVRCVEFYNETWEDSRPDFVARTEAEVRDLLTVRGFTPDQIDAAVQRVPFL